MSYWMTCCLVCPAIPTWNLCVSSSTNVATAGWGSSALPSQTTPWWRRPSVCLRYKLYVHVAQHADHHRFWSENPEQPEEKEKLTCYRCDARADVVNDVLFFPRLIDYGEKLQTKPVVSETTCLYTSDLLLFWNQTSALNCWSAMLQCLSLWVTLWLCTSRDLRSRHLMW